MGEDFPFIGFLNPELPPIVDLIRFYASS